MKNSVFYMVVFTLLFQCSIDRSTPGLSNNEIKMLQDFGALNTESRVQIADSLEPGQPLWLCLTFVSKKTQEPLSDQKVSFYHTSSEGDYQPADPNDETTARLNGIAITDQQGRIFVQTILPGDYGSSEDNRHIHTTVENAKPEAYDIHFKQYTGTMGSNFISGSDQHFLADLRAMPTGTLVTFLTIEVKNAV
ncbi:hypothetical protein E1176_10595 [Fulvivirga sp. RKSG066]|uniref:dioxygenase family protein n=1 Tax=Fulvivirga aurantia TaxID=2529383 RepID=UPI0012BD09FA|nr:hypothetical protein [Fulvivirga aurantia]MTI21466.1 hypothetical protein [Fulvivirga aurantia]